MFLLPSDHSGTSTLSSPDPVFINHSPHVIHFGLDFCLIVENGLCSGVTRSVWSEKVLDLAVICPCGDIVLVSLRHTLMTNSEYPIPSYKVTLETRGLCFATSSLTSEHIRRYLTNTAVIASNNHSRHGHLLSYFSFHSPIRLQ
jgi:hypothetical protein